MLTSSPIVLKMMNNTLHRKVESGDDNYAKCAGNDEGDNKYNDDNDNHNNNDDTGEDDNYHGDNHGGDDYDSLLNRVLNTVLRSHKR